MSVSELVDYFDDDGALLGFCSRDEAEDKNLTTPNAIIFVFDSQGRVWLQQRAETKKHYPGLWDPSACGGVMHGEDIVRTAERELLEESGLSCELHFVEKFLNTFPDETGLITRKRQSYIFVGISDDQPHGNHEVQQFRAFERAGLLDMVHDKPAMFVPCMEIELRKAIAGYDNLSKA